MLKKHSRLIATDCSLLAPALYVADKHYRVPEIYDKNYIQTIKEICISEKVDAVLSLIDPELSLLSKHSEEFNRIGVKIIVSPYQVCETCLDKYRMFKFLTEQGFKCADTFLTIMDFEYAFKENKIGFPVFVKPRYGSASVGAQVVYGMNELKLIISKNNDLLIQEYLQGQELGVDVYIDMISKKAVSIFIKKKMAMRAGETDKAISVKCEKLFSIIKEFVEKLELTGPIDIDVFEIDGEYYISEVNPRFGGGYALALACGCCFPEYIMNNLNKITNVNKIGEYKSNIYMMKYDNSYIVDNNKIELCN